MELQLKSLLESISDIKQLTELGLLLRSAFPDGALFASEIATEASLNVAQAHQHEQSLTAGRSRGVKWSAVSVRPL